ncbi:MAG TPA: type II toxin-antitoxin system PemK/MazF family toxin [Thermoguttaceae bacterium]
MNPQRGEIYLVPFGQEGKPRPVVIVSRDTLNGGNYVIVVPFTTQKLEERKGRQSCVFFNAGEGSLSQDCVAKTDEIQRIFKTEIDWVRGRIGRFSQDQMSKIVRAIRFVIRDDELIA